MSVRIKYAYLKQQTWLYRRNYPKELQPVLGQAMKQSLKTGDARIARHGPPRSMPSMRRCWRRRGRGRWWRSRCP
ncbi:DUF6538 domain-containing protein [Paracoccus sp. J55]|uniref:DUF6538 domain-containing protein n=1 Tax=Paracoccus sp. J55 TaxID=935849 RepID=UPI0035275D61